MLKLRWAWLLLFVSAAVVLWSQFAWQADVSTVPSALSVPAAEAALADEIAAPSSSIISRSTTPESPLTKNAVRTRQQEPRLQQQQQQHQQRQPPQDRPSRSADRANSCLESWDGEDYVPWAKGDRERRTRCWRRLENERLVAVIGVLHGKSPLPFPTDWETCKVQCDMAPGCAQAHHNRHCLCYLGSPHTELQGRSPHPPAASGLCSEVVFTKEVATSHGRDEARRTEAPILEFLMAAPIIVEGAVVALLRCFEKLNWLGTLVEQIKRDTGGQVTVVMFERCVEPEHVDSRLGDARLVRVPVAILFTPPVFAVTYLLALWQKGVVGGPVYFVDGRMTDVEADVQRDPSTWLQWKDVDFASYLVTTTGFSGIHKVTRTLADVQLQTRLLGWMKGWAHGKGPAGIPRPAIESCPEQVRVAPLGPRPRRAIVTFLSNANFVTMARVLFHSLGLQGTTAPVVLAVLPGAAEVASELQRDFPQLVVVPWEEVPPPQGTKTFPRWVDNYAKLNLFRMTDFDELLYLDADVLPMSSVNKIFEDPVVRHSVSPLLGAPDWGKWQEPPSEKLNGGVLLVRPSQALFDCMLKALYSGVADRFFSIDAEQGFLRYFFGGKAVVLPFQYNTQKTVQFMPFAKQDWYQASDVKVLHFVGAKPFKSWSSPEYFLKWRSLEDKETLTQTDEVDDQFREFPRAVSQWKRAYFLLANFSQYLTLFGLYHDQALFDDLQQRMHREVSTEPPVLQPLALAPERLDGGLATVDYLPSVADPSVQRQLSEFAGLMAIARCGWYSKPWVGFTTGSESRKAVWHEGVSLDWVKAEEVLKRGPAARDIIFWYGIFAGDYWTLLEAQHSGMKSVFASVLKKMDIDGDTISMPGEQFWPYGNYIILPYQLLQEYVHFAEVFQLLFVSAYPSYKETCPFFTHSTERERCLGYLLERLLHMWAVLTKTSMTFAVDDIRTREAAGCGFRVESCPERIRRCPTCYRYGAR